jgi:hypothetical protein
MTCFLEFVNERWGSNWALCRSTPNNRARYGRCVSQAEYNRARSDHRRLHTAEALRNEHFHDLGDVASGLYSALKRIEDHLRNGDDCRAIMSALAETAIAKAEGR